jgi:hypothetical protein
MVRKPARYLSHAHLYLNGTSWLTSVLAPMMRLSSACTRKLRTFRSCKSSFHESTVVVEPEPVRRKYVIEKTKKPLIIRFKRSTAHKFYLKIHCLYRPLTPTQ